MADRSDLTALLADPEMFLTHADPELRRLAVAAATPTPGVVATIGGMLGSDPDPAVRRECAEVLGVTGTGNPELLLAALDDPEAMVREAAATGLGETGATEVVTTLATVAADPDEDRLVREAAVASLGAIGDAAALPVLLQLVTTGPPQLRRRCVVALSVFEGPEVENAIRAAASDRNPMVREAAEMIVGRSAG